MSKFFSSIRTSGNLRVSGQISQINTSSIPFYEFQNAVVALTGTPTTLGTIYYTSINDPTFSLNCNVITAGTPSSNDNWNVYSHISTGGASIGNKLVVYADGRVLTENNTLDDGIGNFTCARTGIFGGNVISNNLYTNSVVGPNLGLGSPAVTFTSITSGYLNVSIFGGLSAVTSGYGNFGYGSQAFNVLQTGHDNIAMGDGALKTTVSGNYNVAVGFQALRVSTADENVGIGTNAGGNFSSGSFCTFIGSGSTSTSNGATNSTALGSGATVTASNQIQLGNSSVTAIISSAGLTLGGALGVTGNINCSATGIFGGFVQATSGFRVPSNSGSLNFTQTIQNKIIALWDNGVTTDNTRHDFYGFGISGSILRYHVSSSTANHIFYSSSSSSASNELFRVYGTGKVATSLAAGGDRNILDDGSGNMNITGTFTCRTGGSFGGTVSASLDLNNQFDAQLIAKGATNANKQLLLGFNTTSNFGYIQAVEHNVQGRTLKLNPYEGAVETRFNTLDDGSASGNMNINGTFTCRTGGSFGGAITMTQTDSTISTSYTGPNEIFFTDNGQIRSSDNAHRIIFDRANNILETREFGAIILSSGATSSNRTQTVYVGSDQSTTFASTVTSNGIGFRVPANSGSLNFSTTVQNKIIAFWDNGNTNDNTRHDFLGFGVESGALRYEVGSGDKHAFYASTSSSTSRSLFTINGSCVITTHDPTTNAVRNTLDDGLGNAIFAGTGTFSNLVVTGNIVGAHTGPTGVTGPTGPSISQNMVRLNTANGYGSTNTAIRRFTNTVTNTGSSITYADSATLGATFTINTAGVYGLSYSDQFNGAAFMGLSLNSSQLTTSIHSITAADIIASDTTANDGWSASVSATIYLAVNDVVRAHGNATPSGANTGMCQFIITRIT